MELTEKMYIINGDKASNVQELFETIVDSSFDEIVTYQEQDCHLRTKNIGGGWRSFQSMFNIVNTYFPGTSVEEVAYYSTRRLQSIYCPDIHKVVFVQNTCVGTSSFYGNFRNYMDYDNECIGEDNFSYEMLYNLGTEFKNKLKENGKLSEIIL